jgi:hypothetical protein
MYAKVGILVLSGKSLVWSQKWELCRAGMVGTVGTVSVRFGGKHELGRVDRLSVTGRLCALAGTSGQELGNSNTVRFFSAWQFSFLFSVPFSIKITIRIKHDWFFSGFYA